jgi:hypothetical protein
MFSISFWKIVPFVRNTNVKKYCRTGEATDGNMADVLCILDNYGHKHTLRIFTTYYFSMATTVSPTRCHVTFIHTLPVFLHSSTIWTHWSQKSSNSHFTTRCSSGLCGPNVTVVRSLNTQTRNASFNCR